MDGNILRNPQTSHLQVWQREREKEGPNNKKHVFLMGTESDWMQKYKQNCNEVCLGEGQADRISLWAVPAGKTVLCRNKSVLNPLSSDVQIFSLSYIRFNCL